MLKAPECRMSPELTFYTMMWMWPILQLWNSICTDWILRSGIYKKKFSDCWTLTLLNKVTVTRVLHLSWSQLEATVCVYGLSKLELWIQDRLVPDSQDRGLYWQWEHETFFKVLPAQRLLASSTDRARKRCVCGRHPPKTVPVRSDAVWYEKLFSYFTVVNEPSHHAYIDDIIFYSSTWKQHLGILCQQSERLHRAKLTVNLAKSEFWHTQVALLGHAVGQGQVKPVNAKICSDSQDQKVKSK